MEVISHLILYQHYSFLFLIKVLLWFFFPPFLLFEWTAGEWKWENEDEEAGGTQQKCRTPTVNCANMMIYLCDVIRILLYVLVHVVIFFLYVLLLVFNFDICRVCWFRIKQNTHKLVCHRHQVCSIFRLWKFSTCLIDEMYFIFLIIITKRENGSITIEFACVNEIHRT